MSLEREARGFATPKTVREVAATADLRNVIHEAQGLGLVYLEGRLRRQSKPVDEGDELRAKSLPPPIRPTVVGSVHPQSTTVLQTSPERP